MSQTDHLAASMALLDYVRDVGMFMMAARDLPMDAYSDQFNTTNQPLRYRLACTATLRLMQSARVYRPIVEDQATRHADTRLASRIRETLDSINAVTFELRTPI